MVKAKAKKRWEIGMREGKCCNGYCKSGRSQDHVLGDRRIEAWMWL